MKAKPRKAWAVINEKGSIGKSRPDSGWSWQYMIYPTKKAALKEFIPYEGLQVIRVTIIPESTDAE